MLRPRIRTAAALAMAACAVTLAACRGEESPDDPVAAVDAFLVGGVVDHNGSVACGYLTPAERQVVSANVGGTGCRQAFERARLVLGAHHVTSEEDLRALQAESAVDGDRAQVRLIRAGAEVQFELVKADGQERNEFRAPDSEWRIAGGAATVVPPAAGAKRL